MLDFHMHVWPHGRGTPTPTYDQLAAYCDAAAARGVSQIAITEHSHRFTRVLEEVFPHWARGDNAELNAATDHVLEQEGGADLDAYVDVLSKAKSKGLPLLVGIEVDRWAGANDAMAEVLDDYPFDIRLGSVHWLDGWLFDDYVTPTFANQWKVRDTSAVWSDYVDAVLEIARTGMVDVLAHLDVIKVSGSRPPDVAVHEQRLVDGLASLPIAVELSSAGLRKPAKEIYPSLSLLDRVLDAGLLLTTASDAHCVEQVGEDFDALREVLASRNVNELVTFEARVPRPHLLDPRA